MGDLWEIRMINGSLVFSWESQTDGSYCNEGPRCRADAVGWVDSYDNLWIFSGYSSFGFERE